MFVSHHCHFVSWQSSEPIHLVPFDFELKVPHARGGARYRYECYGGVEGDRSQTISCPGRTEKFCLPVVLTWILFFNCSPLQLSMNKCILVRHVLVPATCKVEGFRMRPLQRKFVRHVMSRDFPPPGFFPIFGGLLLRSPCLVLWEMGRGLGSDNRSLYLRTRRDIFLCCPAWRYSL